MIAKELLNIREQVKTIKIIKRVLLNGIKVEDYSYKSVPSESS